MLDVRPTIPETLIRQESEEVPSEAEFGPIGNCKEQQSAFYQEDPPILDDKDPGTDMHLSPQHSSDDSLLQHLNPVDMTVEDDFEDFDVNGDLDEYGLSRQRDLVESDVSYLTLGRHALKSNALRK